MTVAYNDAASRLWWGIRRYAWLFLAIVPITTGVALLAAHGAPALDREYRASALVIATQRDFAPELFARLTDAVFTGGSVAEKAVALGKLPVAPRDLIPDFAILEPVQDNIITKVTGINTDPELAARIANSAATALAEELNKSGRGVGTFAVQDQARVPTKPDTSTSRPVPVVVGILAGFVLGGGIIGLVLALRRPLLGPGEAAELAGAPVVGVPLLPPLKRGRAVAPETVKGLAALAKRILPEQPATVVIVSCGGDERLRTLLTQLVATVLGERGAVFLVKSAEENVRRLYEQFAPPASVIVADQMPDRRVWSRVAVVVDGPSARARDIPQSVPTKAALVLVVLQGTPLNRVRDAVDQFLPGELDGVVFVRRSTWWPWFRSPAAAPSSTRAGETLDAWARAREQVMEDARRPADDDWDAAPAGAHEEIRLDPPPRARREGKVTRAEVRSD